ncbi:CDP-diacylglycerol--glycerol-3-phosphate 3-phosphatidyltransferase [Candidatus Kryptonium thompsonii]|uniref:CDP-diacylglycerol--glycerol-3-phosphate 3-phosphatidyltransferase n=1 Tax=Candidatus Kryptonium thompsonii TaxID=1633631 RepID=A0A0P1LEA4_9BACT|nr:CDP-alcohol phosphatidyltransferase family protein [Candidatus Kryptonium thompsoni]CUS76342.1 CDP-diacylglycerol--glycerol-3-phosphate 3-phosphatidyltransferase [Candidatus Kryptonium thompsoni]CUS76429.1 CDP-diacylglycerol--glycerol-3-phosphate 3-phosphatidyltransferase [Candidatus Kryptonium thompsoni]CUS79535.1 CDP-diacylglycerol--glycerol-3-phosphate 3-phosphatidyltransferase [Candidatus Kryptonium thompsoni]CUS81585.1 CDP-diacylglycerol--glycerol-3-phosphate 3-phosphatidyltransferase [
MNKKILNISNFLSFSRFIILIPAIYFLTKESGIILFDAYGLHLSFNRAISMLFMLMLYLTDLADGYFARKYNQITEFGKIIDPLADKVCVGAIVLSLVQQGDLPAWYVGVVIGRDLLILSAGAYLSTRIKFVLPSNKIGKYTVTSIAIVIAFAMFKAKGFIMDILITASLAMIFLSLYVYGKRFFEHLKNVNLRT